MLLGVAVMLVILFIAIMFAQTSAIRMEASSLQTAADTIADGVAVYAMNNGSDYQHAEEEAERIKESIEETTGTRIQAFTIDRNQFENESTVDVTVKARRRYISKFLSSPRRKYRLQKTAATKFSTFSMADYTNVPISPEDIPTGSTPGEEVIRYALQFVGNPYVWGGTSLTHGADCSGFVMSIYRHFGVNNIPHSSKDQRTVGTAVNKNLADMKPGDIICYGGHVALYMGNNKIVHAQGRRTGIVISNNPLTYHGGAICVRRIFS